MSVMKSFEKKTFKNIKGETLAPSFSLVIFGGGMKKIMIIRLLIGIYGK